MLRNTLLSTTDLVRPEMFEVWRAIKVEMLRDRQRATMHVARQHYVNKRQQQPRE